MKRHATVVRVGMPVGDAGGVTTRKAVVLHEGQGITTRLSSSPTNFTCEVPSVKKRILNQESSFINRREDMAATTGRAYEDFVPPHNMVTEPATHTLSVDLTAAGYKKEHIRVQLVRSHGLVVVRGERPVAGNRWSRFRLEFTVPGDCDVKGIHARFEGGVVRVTMPGVKAGPAAAGEQVPAAAKTDAAADGAQDGGVAREKAGGRAPGGAEKEDESVQKQSEEEQRGGAAVQDGGHLDQGTGVGGAEAAVASPSRHGGYSFLSERRKLVTTVIGAVLVLFSLGIYVRYSFAP